MSDLRDRVAALSPEQRAALARRLQQGASGSAARTGVAGVAIVSAACRLPGGVRSPAAFWQLLVDGTDAITEVPADRWDGRSLFAADPLTPRRMNSRWGGFIDGIDQFDAAFFGISPREAASMDPQQRLLLEAAWEALEAGGQPADRLAGSPTGVFVGAHSHSSDYHLLQLAQADGIESHSSTGSAHSILANRISYLLDLRGPSMCVDTACSSSLVAVHLACQSLRSGECDLALAGGVNLMLLPTAGMAFSQLQILSGSGRCRTFDAAADGIVRGEGCAMVLLKRLDDALRDGDPVLAVIRGSAVNQDGASNGLTAPNGPSQEAVVRRALALAGIAPERIGLVETHGTGTPLGDPVEVESLARVIGAPRTPTHRCWLGAVKTQIGHLEGAAGIAGLLKAVLCLQHKQIPRNLHFTSLNPHIELAGTALAIPTALTDWVADESPRVSAVSSFGFGGTNAHVVIEEHVATTARQPVPEPTTRLYVLPLSARSPAALMQLAQAHAERLERIVAEALPPEALDDHLHTAAAGRSHHGLRWAVSGANAAELAQALRSRHGAADASRIVASEAGTTGIAFIYSGQGGQWAGMARELMQAEPVFRDALHDVADRFQRLAGWSLLPALIEAGRDDRLADTGVAQPMLFAMQVALTALWCAWGVRPAAIVGHSVGEVAAAHAAGVLSLDDAVSLVWHRSRLMQQAAEGSPGRMAQVELSPAATADALLRFGSSLSIAAHNGPTSTVVSGDPQAMAHFVSHLEQRNVTVRQLAVTCAFHSEQMESVRVPLVRALHSIAPRPASTPLVSTVTGRWATAGDFDAAYWARNVRDPVRMAEATDELLRANLRVFLEIGPHPALGAGVLASAAARSVQAEAFASLRRDRPARPALVASLAALYEAGCDIDWRARSAPGARIAELPAYPWQRQRHWLAPADAAALAFHVTGRDAPAARDDVATAPYEVVWEPAPSALASPWRSEPAELAAWIEREATGLPAARALADDRPALDDIEQRAIAYAWWALVDLGVASHGARIASTPPAQVAVRHRKLWQALVEMLQEGGLLVRDGADGWQPGAAQPPARPLPATAPVRIEQALLDRCGSALADVLRGHTDPLALLFPERGELPSASAMYSDATSARFCNEAVARTVAHAAASCRDRMPRIVEVGAGTGATTAAVLAALSGSADYTFTDVSPTFVAAAPQRVGGAGAARIAYRVLDIEQPPAEQGFARGEADIVIASNVVHATGDLRQTLAHARSMLAPGGLLVMLETVASRHWQTLTFGLTSGWWRFRDAGLRTSSPVLPSASWLALLPQCGFEAAAVATESITRDSLHPQCVIVARARPERAGHWLLVADRGGVARALAARLTADGAKCDLIDAQTVVQGGLARAGASHDTGLHVVHCAALDAAPAASGSGADAAQALATGLYGAASTAAWVATDAPPGTRLWIATRGAQAVAGDGLALSPWQAPLWAFGRSLALEAPGAWGGVVDLAPDAQSADGAEALWHELAESGEDQIAWRHGTRLRARLVERALPPAGRPQLSTDGSYLVTGGLGSLGGRIARWLAARGARHLVIASRSGVPAEAQWSGVPVDDPRQPALQALAALRADGVSVRVVSIDASDEAALRGLFDQLAHQQRPLRGVVHAAAAFDAMALASLTPERLRDAMAAKVLGGWSLHTLTREQPIDLFVLCSSITAVLGAKGLAAYAAGNEFLAALAAHRAALGLPATCVDWGTWAEPRALARQRRGDVDTLGFMDLDEARAFDLLDRLVASHVPRCAVARIDWQRAGAAYGLAGPRPMLARVTVARHERGLGSTPSTAPHDIGASADPATTAAPNLADLLRGLPPADRTVRMAALVRREVARVLGLAQPDAIDGVTGFFDLGLDSLMAVQLRRALSAATALSLPPTLTFNYPNVDALTAHLLARLLPDVDALSIETAAAASPRNEANGQSAGAATVAPPIADDEVHALLRAELAALPDDLLKSRRTEEAS